MSSLETTENMPKVGTVKRVNVRNMTVTAMLSAIAFILMFLDTAVPIMPNFIKLDISELPALIAAFALGPVNCMFNQKLTASFSIIHRWSWRIIELYSWRRICTSSWSYLSQKKD